MMILSEKEKQFIDTYMLMPVTCPARHYSQMLHDGTISAESLLDAEIFLGVINEQCQERWMFRRLFEDYQIRAGVERKRREDPTTQEMDRSAWKNTFAKTWGLFQFARRKIGINKKIAPLR